MNKKIEKKTVSKTVKPKGKITSKMITCPDGEQRIEMTMPDGSKILGIV